MSWNTLRSWLARPAARRRQPARLNLESLEVRLTPAFTVGPAINITQSAGDNAETSIVVNPTNPLNLFAGSTASGVMRYSLDGGATWADSDISAIGDGSSAGDQQMAWDQFGNLFVVYFADANFTTMVGLSVDGGRTFQLSLDTGAFNDQPEIAAGAGQVWIDYPDAGGNRLARGAPVTGLGQVGQWTSEQSVPGTSVVFGGIAIGPTGAVMIVGQDGAGGVEGPGTIRGNVDPDGLGSAPFGAQFTITTSNVGTFDVIPAQPNRTIDAEANVAWDRSGGAHNGRVYMVFADETADENDDTDIFVVFSDNNGATWSPRVRVNDDAQGNGRSQFMPGIAVDQTTGNVAVAFYDARNDSANTRVEVYASVSTDGGVTWEPNKALSGGSSLAPGGFDFGDYNIPDFHGGKFYYTWADTSNSTGDNPAGVDSESDMYTAVVTVTGGGGGGGGGGGVVTPGPFFFSPSPVFEGSATTLNGSFLDTPGIFTAHYVTISWGDGSPDTNFMLEPAVQTFSWPHAYIDNGSYIASVTIKAAGSPGSDFSGNSSVLTVLNAPPVPSITGLPANNVVNEGQAVTLSAGVNDPGVKDTATYAWSVTKNGALFATGANPTFTFTPDDQGSYTVTLAVTDNDAATGFVTQTVTAVNVAPTALFRNNGPVASGALATVFFSNQKDAPADEAVGFRYSYDLNDDGVFDVVDSTAASFTAPLPDGVNVVRGRIRDKDGAGRDFVTRVAVGVSSGNNGVVSQAWVITGTGPGGGPHVKVYGYDGALRTEFMAYDPAFLGGVKVATGDVTGDGVEDYIATPGPGGGPHVKVWDGASGALVNEFMAGSITNRGGLSLAVGDVDADFFSDIIVGQGAGDGGGVMVFSGRTSALIRAMSPYPGFNGAVTVAAGDVDGDGYADILTAAGAGGGPHVTAVSGKTGAVLQSFMAFDPAFRGGINVATGDANGDGLADVFIGQGAGGAADSRVRVFDSATAGAAVLADFVPFPVFNGGVSVAAKDLDGDGRADVVMTPGPGRAGQLLALRVSNLSLLQSYFPYDPAFTGGVYVG